MKNKMAFKLTLYFSATLVLFSIIIGSVFMILFRNHSMTLQKNELEKRAVKMAATLSEFMDTPNPGMGMMGGRQGYGAYIRFLDDIAMTDVWIVDKNLQILTTASMASQYYTYGDLPENADAVVKEVFEGNTTFSEGFSSVLDTRTLTLGTPIKTADGVVGALLLHSEISGLNESISLGFKILVLSISIALALSIILSILLALSFTKPLKKMKNTAIELANGHYSAKTNVFQKDEIGELAATIDILSNRLDLASHESEKLLKLRRDFIANITHELRTPVTVIRGSLEALCDEVVTEPTQVKSYHQQMLNESILLQRLVNDLLDLSRLQNTDFNIEMQEINLCDILKDVVRSAGRIAQLKNVQIKQQQDTELCLVRGDYGRLRQMFLIILDNAIKFSNPDATVEVVLKDKKVSIIDTGIGIAQQDIPYIFDRFYKVKSEENKNGTGLGLAIAKQIADRHNTTVKVNSTEGKGTEFIFQFV
jgi:signal transduction histidine kinase